MRGRPKTYVARHCAECGKELSRKAKGNLCWPHAMQSAEGRQKRSQAIRETFQRRPELLAERSRKVAEANRSPERRERSRQVASNHGMWRKALASITPDARKRQGESQRQSRLAHVPQDVRDLYRDLTAKGTRAAEALALCMEHRERVMARAIKQMEAGQ